MQYSNTSLSFLREKIRDIKVALFKSEINSELSLPNNIVQTISVDEQGHIYFFTSCKGNYAAQLESPFYAYLDYHKKGTDTRLCVSGKAMIVKEEEEAAAPEQEEHGINSRSVVLVKMKIMQAEYSGPVPQHHSSWPQKVWSAFSHMFTPVRGQHYNFN